MAGGLCILCSVLAFSISTYAETGPGVKHTENADVLKDQSVWPEAFELPEDAGMLVIAEGTGGTGCRVSAYEKCEDRWILRMETEGHLGKNGMSNHRSEGDKTTPIGIFRLNTPFGQKPALEGFPEDYLKVTENHVWKDASNRLEYSASGFQGDGEAVGTHWYREVYDYVLDMGYNPKAIAGKGSALFLHCFGQQKTSTSGCVEIPEEHMIEVMRLYGRQKAGSCYIALAPQGCFDQIYGTFGTKDGLSPDGDFVR